MRNVPDFDDLVGRDVPEDERERLRRAHELLVQAGPPPELSPELDSVPWPDDALMPLTGRRARPARRRPVLLAAALATALGLGFVLGEAANSRTTSFHAERIVLLRGTNLERGATAKLELGGRDKHGNWPMVLRVTGLHRMPEGGYYELYLTRGGKPVVPCGAFTANTSEAVVKFSVPYQLERFDKNGWVVTRQMPGRHETTDVVLRAAV